MQTVTMSLIERLETLVDSHGIKGVLTALEEVCRLKADYLHTICRDYEAGETWDRNTRRVAIVARKAES